LIPVLLFFETSPKTIANRHAEALELPRSMRRR
jgi:hypothetical protein